MTRDKLLAAIRVGQKRGSAEAIADAIELAFEMEGLINEQPSARTREEPNEIGIPPNPDVIAPAPVKVEPQPEPPPAHRQETNGQLSLVTLASEAELKAVTSAPKPPPGRIRSLTSAGPSRFRMKLEDAVQFWISNAPDRIRIVPEGRTEEIELDRSVQALPGPKGPGAGKSTDMVKLGYKHPMVDAAFEVQHTILVSDMEVGIDVGKILDELKAKARVMYKPRPRVIEPRRPAPQALRIEESIGTQEGTPEDQDRMAAAARSGKQAVANLSEQIRKG